MSEWKEVIATDFCVEVTDGTHDSPKPVSKGRYLLTSKHLQEYQLDFANAYQISQEDYEKAIARSKVDQYDVLFSMIGTIGITHRVSMAKVDFAVKNMGIFKMGGDEIKSMWLYYWLKTRKAKEYINSTLSGTTQGYITLKALRNFPIQVPNEGLMKSITSFLSSLDDKIAVNRRICENLEAQAQALFKHWFIDFAPFLDKPSGKAERKNGNFCANREQNETCFNSAEVQPKITGKACKFVESELGMIPEGWRVGTLEELVDIKYGKDHKKLNEGNIPAYGSAGLMRTVDEKLYDGESVLIPRKGTLNNIMYVNEAFWTVDTMFYTIPKKSNILKYLYMKLKRIDFNKMNVGTSIPSNSTSQLNKLKIVVPTDEILSRFDGIMSSLLQEIMHSQKESKGLATLRDTLLPKLMSGQIKV